MIIRVRFEAGDGGMASGNSQTLSERCLCGPEIVTDSFGRNFHSHDLNIFILIPTYFVIITGFMSLSMVK